MASEFREYIQGSESKVELTKEELLFEIELQEFGKSLE